MMSSFPGRAGASAVRPVSAHSGRKEFIDELSIALVLRWTKSFPRTRQRPDALIGEYAEGRWGRKRAGIIPRILVSSAIRYPLSAIRCSLFAGSGQRRALAPSDTLILHRHNPLDQFTFIRARGTQTV